MELIKGKSGLLEKIIINLYGFISDYGESLAKPISISIIFIFIVCPILLSNISLGSVISNCIKFIIKPNYYIHLSLEPFKNSILYYDTLHEQTLRAFFQLGINYDAINQTSDKILKQQLKTLYSWEPVIRIISLILLGSLFIAIKRKLE
ncbi:protein of unknown function [Methanocaldococcus lauensis]|nr:protein of unknown function [Methanocaldococcus lauensis]